MSEKIDILVGARNNASPTFNEVKGDVHALKSEVEGIGASSGITSLATSFTAVTQAIQQVGAAFQEVNEIARQGAISTQLKDVLEDYADSAGTNASKIVAASKHASQGTIAEFDLILQANRALQFEVAKTPEQFEKLIGLGTALGRAQGVSDTQALEYLTSGIARESKLILDNLGLIIDTDEATKAYAATLGKTAGELTSYERKQALLAEAFRQSETALKANESATNSAATNFERMDASIKNAKVNLGELFGPAVVIIAGQLAAAAEHTAQALQEVGKDINVDSALGKIQGLRNLIDGLDEGLSRLQADKGTEFEDPEKLWEVSERRAKAQQELTQAYAEYNAAVTRASTATEDMISVHNQGRSAIDVHAKALQDANAAARQLQSGYDPLNVASASLSRETGVLNAALSGTPGWLQTMAREAIEAGGSFLEVAQMVRVLKGEIDKLEGAKTSIRSTIIRAASGVADIVGDQRALLLAQQEIGALDFGIAALEAQVKAGTLSATEFDYQLLRLGDTSTGTFEAIKDADAEAKRFAKEGLADATSAANKAEQAFESLKGKVSGVLNEALNVDVGVDPTKLLKTGKKEGEADSLLLPRQDDVNESARRLADIAVKGFDSPWVDYFRTSFPDLFEKYFSSISAGNNDGLRAQAAQLLLNFEEGLNPELIDKEKAKAKVRKMLIGEQNISALANEIAQELSAEFGASLSIGNIQQVAVEALGGASANTAGSGAASSAASDQLSAAGSTFRETVGLAVGTLRDSLSQADTMLSTSFTTLGTNVGIQLGEIGTTFKNSVVSALDGIGELIATTTDKQLRAEGNLKILEEAGYASGKVWSNGFLQSVHELPSQTLEIIASLLQPYIEQTQARTASLTGAN